MKPPAPLYRVLLWISFLMPTPVLAHQPYLSRQALEQFFPEAEHFVSRKKRLQPKQVFEIERLAGDKVHDVDRDLLVYVAVVRDSGTGRFKSIGAVLMVDAIGAEGLIDLLVAYNLDASVKKVVITQNPGDGGIESEEFLSQFEGKGPGDPWDPDRDFRTAADRMTSRAVVMAVRRGMFLLQAILER